MKKFLLFFLPLLFIGCSSSNHVAELGDNVMLNYGITLSQGGGFTGDIQGYVVDTSGSVSSYTKKRLGPAESSFKGIMNNEQITEINNLFPSILETKYRENGNMTTSITLKKDTTELKYSWEGTYPGEKVPAELKVFYEKVNNIINNLKE